jgi:hypothetical protein
MVIYIVLFFCFFYCIVNEVDKKLDLDWAF